MRRGRVPTFFTMDRGGWYGVRTRRRYWVLRDVRRHPLLYSERSGRSSSLLLAVGPWQLWVKP